MKTNAMTEEFEHMELFGKPVLFTNSRIDRSTIPKGWHCYDIRGSDSDPGKFDTLEKSVSVNHAGSILSPQEIQLPKGEDYRRISDSQNFLGESLTLAEFCQAHGLGTPAGNGLCLDYDVVFNKWAHNEMVHDIELPEPEYIDVEQGMTLGGM